MIGASCKSLQFSVWKKIWMDDQQSVNSNFPRRSTDLQLALFGLSLNFTKGIYMYNGKVLLSPSLHVRMKKLKNSNSLTHIAARVNKIDLRPARLANYITPTWNTRKHLTGSYKGKLRNLSKYRNPRRIKVIWWKCLCNGSIFFNVLFTVNFQNPRH